jgi:hypothetical protein
VFSNPGLKEECKEHVYDAALTMHNAEMTYISKLFEMGDIEGITEYDLKHFIKNVQVIRLKNWVTKQKANLNLNMTKSQLTKWLGLIILPGVTLTLISLLLGRLTIVKQMKAKILKMFGNN